MKDKIVQQFINDVENLLREIYQINSFYLLNKHLNKLKNQNECLDAMNKAPAFFSLTIHSFQYSAIMGLAKIYEPASRESKSINKFLNFIEGNHQNIFDNDPVFKKKIGRIEDINLSTVNNHKQELESVNNIVKNLLSWRDKSFAHNDKKYFLDREALGRDFPLTYNEIEKLIGLAAEILNTYQVGYNGNHTHIIPTNIYDVDRVLNALKV